MSTPAEVNEFWFGSPPTSVAELKPKLQRWYQGGPALDAEIQSRFGGLVDRAIDGELEAWRADLAGSMALILVLDQFPRSVFRGQARAFAGDPRAQQLAAELFDGGRAGDLSFLERHFAAMPFLHAESLPLLERAKVQLARNTELAPDWAQPIIGASSSEQADKYLDVVRRFGRFPHRNEALGRTSTPDEVEFLLDWKEKQAPRVSREIDAELAKPKG